MAEVNNEIKNKRRLVNVKSNLKGKTPTVNDITYGEIAVNYAKGAEFLSMKNEDQKIVTFDRAIEYGKNVKDEANPSNNINYKSVALRDSQTRDNGSTSTADFTSAMGYEIQTKNKGEMGVGTFNKTKDGLLFSVGNGTSSTARANIIEAMADGSVNIQADVTTQGNYIINDKLTVNGDVEANSNKFDVKSTTTTISGSNLNVTATTNINGATNVTGNTKLNGNLVVTSTSNLQGAATLNSTLAVTGNTDLKGGLDVTGSTNIDGVTNITGDTSISGASFTVNAPTTITSNTTINGTLTVTDVYMLINGKNYNVNDLLSKLIDSFY